VELSWAISPETDNAGYNVYRSEQVGVLGTRLNAEPLLTPAFRDMNGLPGRRYFYSVTAVDRSGNESAPSAAVSEGVPAEGQPAP
jgi:fibronectin type 3 domain-containing protein